MGKIAELWCRECGECVTVYCRFNGNVAQHCLSCEGGGSETISGLRHLGSLS